MASQLPGSPQLCGRSLAWKLARLRRGRAGLLLWAARVLAHPAPRQWRLNHECTLCGRGVALLWAARVVADCSRLRWPRKHARTLSGCAVLLLWAARVTAQPVACQPSDTPQVALRAHAISGLLSERAVAEQLAVGLASAGLRVCSGQCLLGCVAQLDLTLDASLPSALYVQLRDAVTEKSLARSLRLGSTPVDARAFAAALYIEELLQASWAELALTAPKPKPMAAHPPAVERELERAWPQPRANWRAALGFSATRYLRALTLLGPQFWLRFIAQPWLETGLRVSYRISPWSDAAGGRIKLETAGVGLFVEPAWQTSPRMRLLLPQGVELWRVLLQAEADTGAHARSSVRAAFVVSHAAALRLQIAGPLGVSLAARLCWALLPALAADAERAVLGVRGLGFEIDAAVDAQF